MKVFIVDISGKVTKYDIALCESIHKNAGNEVDVTYFAPLYSGCIPQCRVHNLIKLIPPRYKNTENIFKRIVKALEVLANYIIILIAVWRNKPSIIHFQWLPLMEISSLEVFILKACKGLSKKSKFVLTIHNVFPHNSSESAIEKYKDRFIRTDKYIDRFIVHTKKTKEEVEQIFGIVSLKIEVIHHGIFNMGSFIPTKNRIMDGVYNIILFGNLTYYKGIDIFIGALKLLPPSYKKRIKATIAGEMLDKAFLSKLQSDSIDLNVKWLNYYLPDTELCKKIDESNIIILPYRQISQSGVLLLSLFFRRYIITSDLLNFKETLSGFTDDMFFETGNANSLAKLIMKYVDNRIDVELENRVIDDLNELYSWDKAAIKSIDVYQRLQRQ